MSRYFLEVSYKGTNYSGFQVQQNTGKTIQAEIEKAFSILQREQVMMTSASRTDAGVHALQNFFHFDTNSLLHLWRGAGDEGAAQFSYKMNAILPGDIVVKKLIPVNEGAHCRFDAVERTYRYYITRLKNPFLHGRAYYYPYQLNFENLNRFADVVTRFKDFTSFSKKKTQVNHFICNVKSSSWRIHDDQWYYEIKADRFLRGMVKGLVGTMLQLAKKNAGIEELEKIFASNDCTTADFSAPSHGLFLREIKFKTDIVLE